MQGSAENPQKMGYIDSGGFKIDSNLRKVQKDPQIGSPFSSLGLLVF